MGMVSNKGKDAVGRFGATLSLKEDASQLERCNRDNLECLELIVGMDRTGQALPRHEHNGASAAHELEAKGFLWAQHVLEAPRAWMCCALYVLITVTAGVPLVSGVAAAVGGDDDGYLEDGPKVACAAVDALIYLFMPQLATLAIRKYQGRPLWHRMAGR
jgi:hypothetical protein